MALQGDVRSLNLASVLQDLAGNEKTGTLTLEQDERVLHLWLEAGIIRLVGMGHQQGPSVVAGLLATGRIAPEDLPSRAGSAADEQKLLAEIAEAEAELRNERYI